MTAKSVTQKTTASGVPNNKKYPFNVKNARC